jgi:hypothetical protein
MTCVEDARKLGSKNYAGVLHGRTILNLASRSTPTPSLSPKSTISSVVLFDIMPLVDETSEMFYSSRVPVAIQEAFLALFAMLASVGRLVAYKARYADYTGPEDSIGVNSERTSTGSKSSKGGVVVAAILGVFLALLMLRWRGAREETSIFE